MSASDLGLLLLVSKSRFLFPPRRIVQKVSVESPLDASRFSLLLGPRSEGAINEKRPEEQNENKRRMGRREIDLEREKGDTHAGKRLGLL